MNNLSMIIMSCDKFSDLWPGHVKMLEKMWPDRDFRTIIVTDKKYTGNYMFDNVKIVDAGENKAWSERLKYALEVIETEYVLLTLDDYFLIKPVSNIKIKKDLKIMQDYNIDYLRLFLRPKCPPSAKIKGLKKIYWIDTSEKYTVNLYSGIWKKEFLRNIIKDPESPWKFEVMMSKRANELKKQCAMSNNKEFVILDVVRKGKLLHKSRRYFINHPGIYEGNREVNSIWYEIKLFLMDMTFRIFPKSIVKILRKIMIKLGYHFISENAGY